MTENANKLLVKNCNFFFNSVISWSFYPKNHAETIKKISRYSVKIKNQKKKKNISKKWRNGTCVFSTVPKRWILVAPDCSHRRVYRHVRDRMQEHPWKPLAVDCKICNICHCKLRLSRVADLWTADISRSVAPDRCTRMLRTTKVVQVSKFAMQFRDVQRRKHRASVDCTEEIAAGLLPMDQWICCISDSYQDPDDCYQLVLLSFPEILHLLQKKIKINNYTKS